MSDQDFATKSLEEEESRLREEMQQECERIRREAADDAQQTIDSALQVCEFCSSSFDVIIFHCFMW
jgi:vacuolar-type H+-ATPase subunit E/Vma4